MIYSPYNTEGILWWKQRNCLGYVSASFPSATYFMCDLEKPGIPLHTVSKWWSRQWSSCMSSVWVRAVLSYCNKPYNGAFILTGGTKPCCKTLCSQNRASPSQEIIWHFAITFWILNWDEKSKCMGFSPNKYSISLNLDMSSNVFAIKIISYSEIVL